MDRFFNMDNKFFQFMSRIADLIILNFLFLICCIPVITIGPAVTAMFYLTLKMIRNEESYIVKGFFHSFRQNLRQGIIVNLFMLAALLLLLLDFRIVNTMMNSSVSGKIIYVILMVIALIYIMIYLYVYPILAKFFNTIRNTFTNALLMSVRHLPYTGLMIVIVIAIPVAILYTPNAQIQSLLLMIFILMGPACMAYARSSLLVKIFDNYIPKEDPEETGTEKLPDESASGSAPAGLPFAEDTPQEAPDKEASPEAAPSEETSADQKSE